MGRSLNREKADLNLGNHSLGCSMWGLIHNLQHNRWNQAKKKLSRKSRKHHSTDEETTRTEESVTSPVKSPPVETKLMPPSHPPKNSMKSRLKSLLTEEMYRKKHRHHRSTSSEPKTPVDQHPESSSLGPLADNNHENLHSDSPRPIGELSPTTRGPNYLKQSEVTEPVRDHTLLRDKLMYAIEQTKYDSLQESKLFLNALDLLNLRKEVFLKVLEDPNSSLAEQLHHRRGASLNKSVSFPASGPSSMTDFKKYDDDDDGSDNNKHLEIVEKSRDVVKKCNGNNNKVVSRKRFKNLKERIKHVIKDTKKENYRVIMDSVHHMIPYGHNRMKDDKFGKYKKKKLHRKTSSLDESSFGRYNQLLDITSNKEAKEHNDRLSPQTEGTAIPRRFGRILSLPDLSMYSSIHTDDFSNASTSVHVDSNSVGLESNKVQENLFETDLNLEELSSSGPQDSGQVSENEFDYQEDELRPLLVSQDQEFLIEEDSSTTLDGPTTLKPSTTPVNQAINKIYQGLLQHTKNEAEFHYVKDMLELSGFTRDELLGMWHSTDHPLDPMLFDEVEGDILVSQPKSSGNEEEKERTCDHLLLFDLINEVLLDIHERSFYYWPKPLTTRSQVHRMPRGYQVLEEVWTEISWLLSWRPEFDQSIDDGVSRDLGKRDRWMSIQMEAESVGLEVEDMIFEELLEEIVSS